MTDKRPWFQFHLSTALTMLLVFASIQCFSIKGINFNPRPAIPERTVITRNLELGFPLRTDLQVIGIRQGGERFYLDQQSPLNFFIDIAFWVTAPFLSGWFCESIIRRGVAKKL